jgi:HAD superfamily hydrolase (TIGR01490 family)
MRRTASPRRIAIFDIDGTIFRSSLIIELFNELVRRGVYATSASREVERNYSAWVNRKGHYNDYVMKLTRIFYEHVGGCAVTTIEPAVKAVIARQKDRVHRYPRQLIRELRAEGCLIMAISNSPAPMVQRFARMLKFDVAIGHTLEIENGVYTGRSIIDGEVQPGMAWMDKVRILRRYIADTGLNVDFKHSVMIGDSEGDLPLLSIVGHPIAFNPSLPLAKIARRKGWRIVVERKDVVYDIRDAAFIPVEGQQPKVPYGHHAPK